MDASVLDAVFGALVIIADPERFGFLFLGVIFGLALGVLPGLGGVVGLTLLLPFTWEMDPYTALAFLMGLSSVGLRTVPLRRYCSALQVRWGRRKRSLTVFRWRERARRGAPLAPRFPHR